MEDSRIVELFLERRDGAITETHAKYGKYCSKIAFGILGCEQDTEECLNDVFLAVWNSIPPENPQNLRLFLAKITRNIALDRYDYNTAQKRTSQATEAIDELADTIPSQDTPVGEKVAFDDIINRFLSSLDKPNRIVFMQRYWYCLSVKEISSSTGYSESKIKTMLCRTRNKLKNTLENEV